MNDPVEYLVTQARPIAGQWRKTGDRLFLPPRAAKYYLSPQGNGLVLAVDDQAAAEAAPEEAEATPAEVGVASEEAASEG